MPVKFQINNFFKKRILLQLQHRAHLIKKIKKLLTNKNQNRLSRKRLSRNILMDSAKLRMLVICNHKMEMMGTNKIVINPRINKTK